MRKSLGLRGFLVAALVVAGTGLGSIALSALGASGASAQTTCDPSSAAPVDVQTSAAACGQAVAVSGTGSASSQGLAISGTNDATGENCVYNQGALPEVTPFPNGTPAGPGSFSTPEVGCIAISGTGNATNNGGSNVSCAWSGINQPLVSVQCIAISGTGNATNDNNNPSPGWGCGHNGVGGVSVSCLAVSATGNAANITTPGASECGDGIVSASVSCFALSGTGNASNTGSTAADTGAGGFTGDCFGNGNPTFGISCVAVSGTGNASNTEGSQSCGYPSNNTPAEGCIAASGTGNASNLRYAGNNPTTGRPIYQSCGVTVPPVPPGQPFSDGTGCVAISGGELITGLHQG